MKNRDRALELVRVAFLQARHKRGLNATTMTLGVLKNRLLQITDRRFDPNDFDAKDMKSFVKMLAPDVTFNDVPPHGDVELIVRKPQDINPSSSQRRQIEQTSKTHAATFPQEGGRIRNDLWLSVMDFASGQIYVWDEKSGSSRPARSGEQLPRMPTLTPIELSEWRLTFLNDHRSELVGADLANVQRWQEQALPTNYLPRSLQHPWNRELAIRVRQRLHDFFSRLKSGVVTASEAETNHQDPEPERDDLVDQVEAARDRGDSFSVGELLLLRLGEAEESEFESLLAQIVVSWASLRGVASDSEALSELLCRLDSFSGANLATVLVNVLRRTDPEKLFSIDSIRDLAYRLRNEIASVYEIDKRSPTELCKGAAVMLEGFLEEGSASVTRFLRTTPATAKIASIELLKLVHRLKPLLIPAERQFLGDLEILVGPAFRKLCEAYERNEDAEVIRRAPEYLENISSHRPGKLDPRLRSSIWLALVQPVLDHLTTVVEDATSRGEVALAPILSLRNQSTKADLRAVGKDIFLSFTLLNSGKGHARDVSLRRTEESSNLTLVLVEPSGPFDIPPEGEQLIRLRMMLNSAQDILDFSIEWTCLTGIGKQPTFEDRLKVSQQVSEPDWDKLLADPPYSLNPVKRPERLYGRTNTQAKLQLAAMAGTSTFVWGQKRIGKTSLLQVLALQLSGRPDTTCILLRMGELSSLHEGQLAHLIAQRLTAKSGADLVVPEEVEFGAGLGRLIPFAEQLTGRLPGRKFIVIIDEFDDLDPAFYTGERGKQFVKALRSVSEVGLTFFFVGSERMDAIYGRHQSDLNKWINVRLDRIDSRTDCRTLIVEPVSGFIEFDQDAVEFITDYTAGNPFYIHNFCYQVFERCLQEHRTFVDENDTFAVRQQLLRTLGPTNFSHFWEDNPVLDPQEKRKQSAENCIALSCIGALGGRYEGVDELLEAQESLQLGPEDRANGTDLRRACARLLQRNVLLQRRDGTGFVIALQVFREWLGENAGSKLLPIWIEYLESLRRATKNVPGPTLAVEPVDVGVFPISEDDMLVVAQRLIFCGRQKDVAEIRSWLRQFDDDGRIEIAFALLQRVAERGFINEGMKARGLSKIEEMIQGKRQSLGKGVWQIVKGRRDDLAVGYVDSEHKSGATTAREIQKMLRPGKCSMAIELDGWMGSHAAFDPLVVIVDDFAGTGNTLAKGLRKFKDKVSPERWQRFIDEGRIALFVMYAFPEAIQAIRDAFPGVDVSAANILGDELRACDDHAQIFETVGERSFATEVLQQIGRELSPSAPLGHGDMGALVIFHNAAPNNTLPIFWSSGSVGERPWKPLFPRA